jgi:hypothetical protein
LSDAQLDDCGVCDGIENYEAGSCYDCAGTPNGDAVEDCAGVCGGDAIEDACEVCGGNGCYQNDCETYPFEQYGCDADCDFEVDCNGDCGGTAEYDECGVCNGDNSSCVDCLGVPNGDAVEDCFGVCDGDAVLDGCGVCNGDAGLSPGCCGNGEYDQECPYNINLGEMYCVGGSTGNVASFFIVLSDYGGAYGCDEVCFSGKELDCNGECGGDGIPSDCCGTDVWSEDCETCGTAFDACGTCDGLIVDLGCGCNEPGPSGCDSQCGSTLENDCAGVCDGGSYTDECDNCVCGGGIEIDTLGCVEEACVQDCAGVYGGSAYEDNCGVCDSDPDNDCVQDCLGIWGGSAVVDECGVCDGGGYINCSSETGCYTSEVCDASDCIEQDVSSPLQIPHSSCSIQSDASQTSEV